MGLKYVDMAGDEQAVRSHTGLTEQEFCFWQRMAHYIRHYTWEGKERQSQSNERKNGVLSSIEDKLLFILFKPAPGEQMARTAKGKTNSYISQRESSAGAQSRTIIPGCS